MAHIFCTKESYLLLTLIFLTFPCFPKLCGNSEFHGNSIVCWYRFYNDEVQFVFDDRLSPNIPSYRKIEIKKQANFSGDLKYAMYYDYECYVYNDSLTKKLNNKSSLNDTVYIPNLPLVTVVSQIAHNSLIPSSIKSQLEGMLSN